MARRRKSKYSHNFEISRYGEKNQSGKEVGERRTVAGSRTDEIAEALAAAGTVDEICEIAESVGFEPDDLQERIDKAPNFGQFRMVVGNLMRGAANRMARMEEAGEEVNIEYACYPRRAVEARKAARAAAREAKAKDNGKARTSKKKVAKKVAKKKVAKKTRTKARRKSAAASE